MATIVGHFKAILAGQGKTVINVQFPEDRRNLIGCCNWGRIFDAPGLLGEKDPSRRVRLKQRGAVQSSWMEKYPFFLLGLWVWIGKSHQRNSATNTVHGKRWKNISVLSSREL